MRELLFTFGFALLAGGIFADGRFGLYCLVLVSACMSLMFPTIYGMALEGTGDDAKIGAAGLIMAILGGSILPPVQARVMDVHNFEEGPLKMISPGKVYRRDNDDATHSHQFQQIE